MTCRITAVLMPLNEKSSRPASPGAFRSRCVMRVIGNGIARSLPSPASLSMIGPPGYPRPSSFATLSYASPAASSLVRAMSR